MGRPIRQLALALLPTCKSCPRYRNKKPAPLGSAFLFGKAQGLNLRAARDQSLVLFVDPGFFKEVGAVRVYRRVCDGHTVVYM